MKSPGDLNGSAPIDLIAIGPVEEGIMVTAEMAVWQTFGREVRRLPSVPDAAGAFDPARGQWSSSLMLKELVTRYRAGGLRLLGVTEKDLFIPMLSFVFGQAQLDGRAALVSAARLRPEFYGLPESRPLLLTRLAREVIHEMGHTFGLVHCLDPVCPMSLSTSIRQVDHKGSELCEGCRISLREHPVWTGRTGRRENSR